MAGGFPADTFRRLQESGCLGVQPQEGGRLHLKLNTGGRPIANKYREGKTKRTLKRELKVLEIAEREADRASRRGAPDHGGEGGRTGGGTTASRPAPSRPSPTPRRHCGAPPAGAGRGRDRRSAGCCPGRPLGGARGPGPRNPVSGIRPGRLLGGSAGPHGLGRGRP